MSKGEGSAPDDDTDASKTHADVTRTVANVSEQVLTGASALAGVTAVVRAVAGEVPVAGPVVATAVASLLPVVIAAVERRRETQLTRVKRARIWADEAWDAIVATREG
jgi:predicted phosphoribosyltransferase